MYFIQRYRSQHLAVVAYKARSWVIYRHPGDQLGIQGAAFRDKDAVPWPVHHLAAACVPRAYYHILTLAAGIIQPYQVFGIMRKVGIHLKDVFITVLQRPVKSGNVRSTQSQFA